MTYMTKKVSFKIVFTNTSIVSDAIVAPIFVALLYLRRGFPFNLPALSRTHQPKPILPHVLIFLFSFFVLFSSPFLMANIFSGLKNATLPPSRFLCSFSYPLSLLFHLLLCLFIQ